jgi:hypothetical protein
VSRVGFEGRKGRPLTVGSPGRLRADNRAVPIDLGSSLERSRNTDGGFGPVPGALSEPEPTSLVAIALQDRGAREWLLANQRSDGSVALVVGNVVRDLTALASLGVGPGPSRERGLDHLVDVYGQNGPSPGTAESSGWPWTDDAHGWVEPTAWGLLALRSFRPAAMDRIADAERLFAERECVGGGWNFGTRTVFDVDLQPYVQTTGIALIALHGVAHELARRGFDVLRSQWRREASGLLSLAIAVATFAVYGDSEATPAAAALERAVATGEAIDTTALAWAAIALGSGLERVTPS